MLSKILSVVLISASLLWGCKTTDSRVMENEDPPEKRGKWGKIAVATIAVTAAVFGGSRLFRFVRRSEADKLISEYKSLLKKSLKNPDNAEVQTQLADVTQRIDNMIATETDEAVIDSFQKKLMRKTGRLNSKQMRGGLIEDIRSELDHIRSGKADEQLLQERADMLAKGMNLDLSNPRTKYSNFEDFFDAKIDNLFQVVKKSTGADENTRDMLERIHGEELLSMWEDYRGWLEKKYNFSVQQIKREKIEILEEQLRQIE